MGLEEREGGTSVMFFQCWGILVLNDSIYVMFYCVQQGELKEGRGEEDTGDRQESPVPEARTNTHTRARRHINTHTSNTQAHTHICGTNLCV